MAFDKPTRNRLAAFVGEARGVITEEFTRQFQGLYGISAKGEITPLAQLGHLDDAGLATATLLRERIEYLVRTHPDDRDAEKAAVARLAREQAFTVLNRLAAIRMAEKRGFIVESVGKGYQSKGFKVFEQVAGSGLGETYHRYSRYLYCLFDELAVDLGLLFDRRSPQGLLFPQESALQELLKLLNAPDLDALWAEDETIGWIYQYYNDPAERKKMRDESSAPRNSRELAVRNQFFTPRYVVEFLTDNTLGRIWYEMAQGQTRLKDQCRYLVRRPTEFFLKPDELAPEAPTQEGLSQEELLKQPVYLPHRPLKDPREIRMLDPACGSMHFGLYAFDLLEVIYEEAWDLGLDSLRRDFPTKEALLREVPRLIIEHNIHGIDIDPRAVQIAGLSIWLRAQKSWQAQRVSAAQRPRILRSNIVCAEPMPGSPELLREFTATLHPPLLGQLVEKVFAHMQLAGEAGSLLKIEEEIATLVQEAKEAWYSRPKTEQLKMGFLADTEPKQGVLPLDLSGITDDQFWETAEDRIYAALRAYAEEAESGGYQRRLFAEDAARGFAFIDLCRMRCDVALMNPPFGDASLPSKPYLDETYGDTKGDVYKAFVECFQARLIPAGYLGIISSRTGFFLGQSEDWRTRVVLRLFRPIVLADLGMGVLDAMVEVAAYVLRSLSAPEARDLTLSLVPVLEEVVRDKQDRFSLPKWQAARAGLKRHQAVVELEHLEAAGFIQRCPGDIVRYAPVWRLVKAVTAPPEPVFPPLVCVRALAEEDKGAVLAEAIREPKSAASFVSNPADFLTVSGAPFSYWVSAGIRALFSKLPALETDERIVRQGLATADDFRFIRVTWESAAADKSVRWFPFVKGGKYSPFYADVYLLVHWQDNGKELKAWADPLYGNSGWSRIIKSTEHYFKPGLTWPLRAKAFSPQAMPRGCVFSVRGYAILAPASELAALLGATASSTFDYLFKVLLGRFGFPEFVVGVLQKLPLPQISDEFGQPLSTQARRAWATKRALDTVHSTSHAFLFPALLATSSSTLAERAAAWSAHVRTSEETVAAIQAEIDDLVFCLYGLDAADRAALTATLTTETTAEAETGEDEEEEAASADTPALVADLLAYAFGAAYGRWDLRFATGAKPIPPEPDPFDPLPVCPPGMLQNADGLPAEPKDVPTDYPLRISWPGILVDDENHPEDMVARVREALEVVWKDRADTIEAEACEILGVKTLRDYFRRPSSFFADHLKRYSKSRRQAPIYWPLSTAKGSYTLWIYYHRLTDQSLHTALADFVDPKLRSVRAEISALRESTAHRDRLEELLDLEGELQDFRAEIERIIKLPWKPNLNDGVLITASLLWKLFRLPKWQKDLRACWEKLEGGDYDWAHLAYAIWPKRVEEVCKQDRSIAIAHGLEHLCQVEAPKPKGKRGKKKAIEPVEEGEE